MKVSKYLLPASVCVLFSSAVCVPAQPFELTGVQRLTNQEMVVRLSAPLGRAYRLESTGNSPDWSGLITFPTNTTTSLVHTDSAAPYLDALEWVHGQRRRIQTAAGHRPRHRGALAEMVLSGLGVQVNSWAAGVPQSASSFYAFAGFLGVGLGIRQPGHICQA